MELWTPTDWAEETRLRIEYIKWKIEHNELPCLRLVFLNLGLITSDPEQIMQLFQEQGVLFYNSEDVTHFPTFEPLTFEEWGKLYGPSPYTVKVYGVHQNGKEVTMTEAVENIVRKF